MTLSAPECDEAYVWLLRQLRTTGADDVAAEIEAIVRAGTIREDAFTRRDALAPQERLVVALRMVLATACVPLMLESVAELVEPPTTVFEWAPDYLLDVGTSGERTSIALSPNATLRELDSAVRVIDAILDEMARAR